MAGKRTGSIRADAVKKFFPQASTKDIVKYLENLRWIEETLFQWASIVESTDDAIYTKDFNGIITSWNPAAERIYGYSASEIVGQSILKIFPDDRKGEFKKIISKIRKGIKIDHYRTLRKTKSGDLIDVSVTISPTRDITGKIVGASVIARNITEEKKVADLKQRFSSIVESSSDAIIGKNLSGIITSWNNGAEAM
jgi:two-component system, OmpR family, sensor histidine kinase VicK